MSRHAEILLRMAVLRTTLQWSFAFEPEDVDRRVPLWMERENLRAELAAL